MKQNAGASHAGALQVIEPCSSHRATRDAPGRFSLLDLRLAARTLAKITPELALWALVLLASGCATLETETPTAVVERGRFEKVLTIDGRLAASETLSVTSEAFGKIAFMATEGVRVSAGEPLFGLETKEMEDQHRNALLDLSIAESGLAKATEEARSDAVKSGLSRREKDSQLAWAKLKAERAQTELERKRRQVENKILPRKDLLGAELEVEQAALEVTNAEIDVERFREESASRKQTLELDRQSAEARLEKTRSQVEEARDYIEKATVKAPRDGVVVHAKGWRGTFKVGDEVWDGVAIMELPDLEAMEVQLEINEVDISQVKAGLAARIRVEALPDLLLTGKVTEIQALAKEVKDEEGAGTGVRVFDAVILPDAQDDRLRPGMTARVEIVLGSHEDALLVPMAALRRGQGPDAEARVVLASGEEREVEVLGTNADVAALDPDGGAGLAEGDVVRLELKGGTDESGAAAVPAPSGPSSPGGPSPRERGRGGGKRPPPPAG